MKNFVLMLFALFLVTVVFSQSGITKYGQRALTNTVFVNENGKTGNVKSLNRNGSIIGPLTVVTSEAIQLNSNEATCGGYMSGASATAIAEKGVCWSTNHNPTILNPKVSDGTENRTFSGKLTGLSLNTFYYIRAFVRNSTDTIYGNEVVFNLVNQPVGILVDGQVSGISYPFTGGDGGQFSTVTYSGYPGPITEYVVTIKNISGNILRNVFYSISNMSLTGRDAVNSDFGFYNTWFYGDLAPGDSASRLWRLAAPNNVPYVFNGHVKSSNESYLSFYESGAGTGWAATIQNVYLESYDANLTVSFSLNPVDDGNNFYILIDDLSQPGGWTDLTSDIGLSWGSFGLTNSAGLNVDFSCAAWRSFGTFNAGPSKKLVNGTVTDVSTFIITTADTPLGQYKWTIPYSAIGTGASSGGNIRVYILYGKDMANGGIHSAAPVMSPAQITNMNSLSNSLKDIDVPAPIYILK